MNDTESVEEMPVPVDDLPEADATSQDHLVEQTDNFPDEEDGDQLDVSQEPVQESDVQ